MRCASKGKDTVMDANLTRVFSAVLYYVVLCWYYSELLPLKHASAKSFH